ncbi:MAG: hypothetical protein ABW106_03920, partial [Steroidobacteraceae bacterium]
MIAKRIRVLVATPDDTTGAGDSWANWQAARAASNRAEQMVLQRVSRAGEIDPLRSVGLGYGEVLRWFGPVADDKARRLILDYAAAVLDAGAFPLPSTELQRLAWSEAYDPANAPEFLTEGIVLLSHAETDLLALERARAELPAGFPAVVGHSLIGLDTQERLLACVGMRRSKQLVIVVRVHGAA